MKKYIVATILLCTAATAVQAQSSKDKLAKERTIQPVKVSIDGSDGLGIEAPLEAPSSTDPKARFTAVEQMPEFPGGSASMLAYLESSLMYPPAAKQNGIEGKVYLKFVVEADGTITDVEVLRKLDPECDKEAIRVVKNMPKWKPGKQSGNAVAVYNTIPVAFSLNKH